MAGYIVAITGRPNVGKSTLFNRLLEQRKAIVEDKPGVTRDRQYGVGEWSGRNFTVIDTGGFIARSEEVFDREIRKQVMIAVEEAHAIIFMCDVTTGITELDNEMAHVLRRSAKPVYLVVNKVDNAERQMEANEFYSLGFEKIYPLSSISGSGTGELLDDLVLPIPPSDAEETVGDLPKFAIVGQPNTGKSSLLNALLGNERTIVSDVAGTTRDTIHTRYNLFQKDFILIDTAGIRRKARVEENIEFYSVIRAIRAMDEADVCLLMIDAQKGLAQQDLNIFSLAAKKGKGVVLLVNKWDLVSRETNTARDFEKELRSRIAPFSDVPILFISAKEKTRIYKVIETALEVYENRQRRVPTSTLNEVMQEAIQGMKPPVVRGNTVKIKYVTQLPTVVPSFAFFTNYPDDIKESYRNYLENRLREAFSFRGVPIRLFFRKK